MTSKRKLNKKLKRLNRSVSQMIETMEGALEMPETLTTPQPQPIVVNVIFDTQEVTEENYRIFNLARRPVETTPTTAKDPDAETTAKIAREEAGAV